MSVSFLHTRITFSRPVALIICYHSLAFLRLLELGYIQISPFLFGADVMLLAYGLNIFVLPIFPCFFSCYLLPLLLSVTATVNFTAVHDRDDWWIQIHMWYFLRDSANSLKNLGCLWSVFSDASCIGMSTLH